LIKKEEQGSRDFKVGHLTVEEKKAFLRLIGLSFGGNAGEGDFFSWKYESFPGLKLDNTIVVRKNGLLVGAITLWPMDIRISPTHTLRIHVAGGAATHSNFRKKGIWWMYMDEAKAVSKKMGASLLFGYVTSATVTYKARVARGIRELFTQHYFVKILNYPNFFKAAVESQESKSMKKFSNELGEIDEVISIFPKDDKPFSLKIKGGKIEILEAVARNPTATIKGEVNQLIHTKSILQIFKLLLTRKIAIRVSIWKIRTIYNAFKAFRSVT